MAAILVIAENHVLDELKIPLMMEGHGVQSVLPCTITDYMVEETLRIQPDVVIVDMDTETAQRFAFQLRKEDPQKPMIVLSHKVGDAQFQRALLDLREGGLAADVLLPKSPLRVNELGARIVRLLRHSKAHSA